MARFLCIATLTFSLFSFAALAQTVPPAIESLPPGAMMVVEIEQPSVLYNLLSELKIPESPEIRGLLNVLGGSESADRVALIHKLAGAGIIYASYPGDASLTIADGEDAATASQIRQLMQTIARSKSTEKGVFYKEFPGGASWSLDGKQFWASTGNRLFLSSHVELLKAVFEPRARGGVSASVGYREARSALGGGSAATIYLNMEMLNKAAPVQKALAGDGSALDIILNAALRQSLRESKWAAMNMRVQGRDLLFRAAADGKLLDNATTAFSIPRGAEQGLLPNLTVPNQIAAISMWRDLGKFYTDKEALFPEKTSGGILFENFMEIFFSGRDLNAEVFSRFHPEVRLVAARQKYDSKIGVPHDQYPAAALIFRADHAEEFGELVEEAWQKAIGITNFTAGQQALPGLIIDRESHGGTTFSYSYYSARNEKDRANLPVRFNMRPSLARVGPYLVLSTTDALTRDVIDAVNREDGRLPAVRAKEHTVIELSSGEDIAKLLAVNSTELTKQSVVGSGKTLAQAKTDFDFNQALLRRIERARLSIGATDKGSEANLEVRLK
jgi:hypothetical protein